MVNMRRLVGFSALLALSGALMFVATGVARAQDSDSSPLPSGDNATCLGCHGKDGTFDKGSPFIVDEDALKASVHRDSSCTDCHAAITKSPHGKDAEAQKVNCLDCHEDTINKSLLAQPDPPGGYAKSVHVHKVDPATRKELPFESDKPVCLTCHSPGAPHSIKSPSTWNKLQMAENCSKCHLDKEIMARHGVRYQAAQSYFQSFHGKAIVYGSEKTATCVNCHNAHNVQNPKKMIASTNPANLAKTCSQCHPNANYNFSMAGTGHILLQMDDNWLVHGTYDFFCGLAAFTFTMLLIALSLDVRRRYVIPWMRRRLRRKAKVAASLAGLPIAEEPAEDDYEMVERWTTAQRLQHGLLAVSITILVLTGFPLRFPQIHGMARVYEMMGGVQKARVWHRDAAILLIFVAVWHLAMLVYNYFRNRPRPREWAMLWNWQDFRDMRATAAYYVGKRETMPKFARYSFREKIDYMCEYWGVPVMVISGFVLWFPGVFAQFVPGSVISLSYVAHGIEATIAAVVIITWHMYQALVVAGVKSNRAWLSGKVTLGYLKHHHELEYEKLMAARGEAAQEERQPPENG